MGKASDRDVGEVLKELAAREPIFHRPEFGTMRGDFEAMIAPEFWETGASGRRYSRDEVLDALEKRHAEPHNDVWETSEFRCQPLADDLYLVTYTLLQDRVRLTRRATIWRRTVGPDGRSSTTKALWWRLSPEGCLTTKSFCIRAA